MQLTPLGLTALPLLCSAAFGQAEWTQQFPVQQPDLRAVDMLSALDGWVAGTGGVLRHTTSGGFGWVDTTVPATDLRDVLFRGGHLGWAVGSGVFRTTDVGQTWQQTSSATGLTCVDFADDQRGWASAEGGSVHRTLDGGATWSAVVVAPGVDLFTVDFINANDGWVVGAGGAVFRSFDGGAGWLPLAAPSSANLTDVHFASDLVGWAAAGTTILHTTDGGQSWQPQTLPPGRRASAVEFLIPSHGWAVGPVGTILSTTDGGATWIDRSVGGSLDLRDIGMGDLFSGLAVGEEGTIYRTTDGGASWTLIEGGPSAPSPGILGLDAVDDEHAWASNTQSTILRTSDGGATWTGAQAGVNTIYRAVSFADTLNGYACGEKQAFYPTLAWTHDGGVNWSVRNELGMYDYNAVEAIGPQDAIVVGSTWITLTHDGGVSWHSQAPMPYGTYHGVDFVNASTGWMVGTNFKRTVDGGNTWQPLLDPASTYYDVAFYDFGTGWAVGQNGSILFTSNGGASWTEQGVPGTPTLRAVEVLNPFAVWVAGDDGYVARTLDGGATWEELGGAEFSGTAYGLAFSTEEEGWAIGDQAIFRRAIPQPTCAVANYCQGKVNSAGSVAVLSGVGMPAAGGLFQVAVNSALPGRAGIMIYGTNGAGSIPLFGGTLCVALPFQRMGVQFLDGFGATLYDVPVDTTMAGETRWFQFWYRDQVSPDGAALSDGLRVTFCQ